MAKKYLILRKKLPYPEEGRQTAVLRWTVSGKGENPGKTDRLYGGSVQAGEPVMKIIVGYDENDKIEWPGLYRYGESAERDWETERIKY